MTLIYMLNYYLDFSKIHVDVYLMILMILNPRYRHQSASIHVRIVHCCQQNVEANRRLMYILQV